jgi:hypothetical protein
MQRENERDQGRPSMDSFTGRLKSSAERYIAFFLALTLLAALWSTALGRLSERATAEELLTRAGTDIINPLLTANNSGIDGALYGQLQNAAQAHPNTALAIGFLKISIPGKAIAGKDFAAGSRVIYAAVADAYYRLGPNGVFALPPELQQVVQGYTPFVQGSAGVKSPLPNLPIPQLPSFATNLYAAVGITPTTLTADGHATAVTRSLWLWLIAGALALLLVLMNRGWDRLWSIAWPLFHSSWHIALFGVIATVLVNLRPIQAKPYLPILTLISGTFMVVFYVAAVLGIALVIVSLVGNRLSKGQATEEHTREPAPALVGARRTPDVSPPAYGADAPLYSGPTAPAAPYPPQTGYTPPTYAPPASYPPPLPGDGGAYPPTQSQDYRPYPETPPQS